MIIATPVKKPRQHFIARFVQSARAVMLVRHVRTTCPLVSRRYRATIGARRPPSGGRAPRGSHYGMRLTSDIRIALRGFRRTPAFAITVLVILGLGIGTAVATLAVFRAVLITPLPVRDPARLVVLTTFKDPAVEFGLVLKDLKEIHAASNTLQDIAGYAHWGVAATPWLDGDRSLILNRVTASGNLFDVLGTRPLLGRLLRPADAEPGAEHVVVLSYNVWRQSFGGDPKIVGRTLLEPYAHWEYTIVGVTPPGLDYPSGAGLWLAAGPDAGGLSIIGIGRLAPGATLSAARSELFAIKQRLSPAFHLEGANAVEFTRAVLGNVRPVLTLLTAAVALLLLIACVNVGNLLLLRAGSRSHEVAIRRALGASYRDIVQHQLLESAMLAIGGGVLGLLWAEALLRILVAFAPAQLPRTDMIQLAGTPVPVAISVALLAMLLFGVVPAFFAAGATVATTLRLDSRSGRNSRARHRLRHVLVATQTTLALIMLAGGLLLARSLARLERVDLGYNPDHLAFLAASWPMIDVGSGPKLLAIGEQISRRWGAVPGVVSVSPVIVYPLVGPNVFLGKLIAEGQSPEERAASPFVAVESGGEAYFRTLGIPIRRGRGFVDADNENAPHVAIVSETVARRTWPGEDPVGKRIQFWDADSTVWRTVVGVVGDVRLRTLRDATPEIYLPWRQAYFQNTYAVRTSGSLASVRFRPCDANCAR